MRALLSRIGVARERGFALVELLVTVGLLGGVLTALMTMLATTVVWSSDVQEASVHQTEARAALDELARDLRQAYSGTASSPIESVSPTQLVFTSPDRSTPFRLRRITYRLVGGRLERTFSLSTTTTPPWTYGTQRAWATRVRGIRNAAPFSYLDAGGAATTNAASVRTVNVMLQSRAGAGQGTTSTYRTSVTLRASA